MQPTVRTGYLVDNPNGSQNYAQGHVGYIPIFSLTSTLRQLRDMTVSKPSIHVLLMYRSIASGIETG